jgi:hypothetical protein
VRLWDVRAPRAPLLRLSLHKEPVMALALDARGRRGASGAADAQARGRLLIYSDVCVCVLTRDDAARR